MAIEYIRLKFDNQGQLTKAATNETALEAVLIDNFNIEDRRIMLQKELNKSTTDNRIKMSLFASNTDGKYTLFYNGLCCLYEKLRNNTQGSSAVSNMIHTNSLPSEYYTFSSPNELHCKSLILFKLDFTKQPTSFTIDSQKIDTVVFQNTDLSWYSAPISLKNQYLQSGVPNKEEFGNLTDMKTLVNINVKSANIGYLLTRTYDTTSGSVTIISMTVVASLDTNDPKNNILRLMNTTFMTTTLNNVIVDGVNSTTNYNDNNNYITNSSTNLLTKNNTKEGVVLITPRSQDQRSWGCTRVFIEDVLLEPESVFFLHNTSASIFYKKITNINVIDYQDLQASDLNDKPRIFSIICSTSNVGYMKTESKSDIYNQIKQSTALITSISRIVTPVPSDSYIYLVEAAPSYDTPTGDSNGIGDSDTLMVIKVAPSDFNKFGYQNVPITYITTGDFGFFQDLFKDKGVNISSSRMYIDYKNNKYITGYFSASPSFIIPSGYSNPFTTNNIIKSGTVQTPKTSPITDDLYEKYPSFMTIPFKDLP